MNFGAIQIWVIATHGIFSGPAIERINENNSIKYIFVTNSIDQTENLKKTKKIIVIDSSKLLSDTIQAIFTGSSISALF